MKGRFAEETPGHFLAIDQFRFLIENLAAWRNKFLVGLIKAITTEEGHAVTILESKLDVEMSLNSCSHCVAREHAQELPACLLIWWGNLVINKLRRTFREPICHILDEMPGIGQRIFDAGKKIVPLNFSLLRLFE